MSKTETLTFQLVRGSLTLKSGKRVLESGTTNDAEVIKELRELAAINSPSGHPQYVVIPDEVQVNATVQDAEQEQPKTADEQGETTEFKLPAGVSEADVDTVRTSLEAGGLTFESANALSDKDIKAKTENIGDARIKLIRAIGEANSYPAYQEQE